MWTTLLSLWFACCAPRFRNQRCWRSHRHWLRHYWLMGYRLTRNNMNSTYMYWTNHLPQHPLLDVTIFVCMSFSCHHVLSFHHIWSQVESWPLLSLVYLDSLSWITLLCLPSVVAMTHRSVSSTATTKSGSRQGVKIKAHEVETITGVWQYYTYFTHACSTTVINNEGLRNIMKQSGGLDTPDDICAEDLQSAAHPQLHKRVLLHYSLIIVMLLLFYRKH